MWHLWPRGPLPAHLPGCTSLPVATHGWHSCAAAYRGKREMSCRVAMSVHSGTFFRSQATVRTVQSEAGTGHLGQGDSSRNCFKFQVLFKWHVDSNVFGLLGAANLKCRPTQGRLRFWLTVTDSENKKISRPVHGCFPFPPDWPAMPVSLQPCWLCCVKYRLLAADWTSHDAESKLQTVPKQRFLSLNFWYMDPEVNIITQLYSFVSFLLNPRKLNTWSPYIQIPVPAVCLKKLLLTLTLRRQRLVDLLSSRSARTI